MESIENIFNRAAGVFTTALLTISLSGFGHQEFWSDLETDPALMEEYEESYLDPLEVWDEEPETACENLYSIACAYQPTEQDSEFRHQANLDQARRLAQAVRKTFVSANKPELSLEYGICSASLFLRRTIEFSQLKSPLEKAEFPEVYEAGMKASGTVFGRPGGNCGEIALATLYFIARDYIYGEREYTARISHFRIVIERDGDHAMNMVKMDGRWYSIDGWDGNAEPLEVNDQQLPKNGTYIGSQVFFFLNGPK